MPRAPWALAPTSMVVGFGVTGSHTNVSHSVPSSGWNCSPSWLLPAHGVPSGLGYASTSIVTTSPFPGLVKTVHKTAWIHATVPNPVLWGSPAQFHHPHSHPPDRLNSITNAIPEITYPCFLLLPPRRTLNQYQLHTTGLRSELPSPTPTGQSCSPIYENYSIGIRISTSPSRHQGDATQHHSSTTGMGCHSQPMFYPSAFLHLIEQCGFDAAKFNTPSLRIGAASTAARAGLPSDTIQKLVRWRSSAYETYTRHLLTHPSDTRTMAAAQ